MLLIINRASPDCGVRTCLKGPNQSKSVQNKGMKLGDWGGGAQEKWREVVIGRYDQNAKYKCVKFTKNKHFFLNTEIEFCPLYSVV